MRTDAQATAPTDWANETIVGIVPLVIRREPTQVGSIRVLTYPLHGWGSFYSPLGACPDLTLHHALRYLANCPRDYDLLDLRWVDNRQGLGDLTQSAMQQHGFAASQNVWFDTYQVDLRTGWDAYWQSRTSHWRTNVRSNLKSSRKVIVINSSAIDQLPKARLIHAGICTKAVSNSQPKAGKVNARMVPRSVTSRSATTCARHMQRRHDWGWPISICYISISDLWPLPITMLHQVMYMAFERVMILRFDQRALEPH